MIKPGTKAIFKPMINGKRDVKNPQYGKKVYIIQVDVNHQAVCYGFRCVDDEPVYFRGGEALQWANRQELELITEGNL